jgi:hypothetical protein
MTKEQFESITNWQRITFPEANALSKIHHLEQEVLELELDLVSDNDKRSLEFADCILLIFGAACADGMTYEDICKAIDDKMEINKKRTWGNPDANGVVNHLK